MTTKKEQNQVQHIIYQIVLLVLTSGVAYAALFGIGAAIIILK